MAVSVAMPWAESIYDSTKVISTVQRRQALKLDACEYQRRSLINRVHYYAFNSLACVIRLAQQLLAHLPTL